MKKAIYKIENIINHKIYIGQTTNPNKRWWQHNYNTIKNIDNLPIHNAIKKYGKENFIFTVLEWTENYDEREKELIKYYNCQLPNGYNVSSGGENNVMYGENNPRNTIKKEVADNIISDLIENKLSDRQIAKKYNTTDNIVADINHGITHYKNDINYPIRIKKGLQKIKTEEIKIIKDLLKNSNKSYKQIADLFQVSKGAIYHINKGLTFFNSKETYPLRSYKK